MQRARRPAPQAGRVDHRLVHPVLVGMTLVVLAFGINSMSGALHFQNFEWGATKIGSVKVAVGFVAPSLYEHTLQSTMNITPTNDVLEKLDRLTKELAKAKLKLAQDEVKALKLEVKAMKLVVAKAKRAAAKAARVAASKLELLEDKLKLAEDQLKLNAKPAPAHDAVPSEKHEQACESAITWWRLPRVIVRRGRCPMLTASGRRAPEFLCGPLPDANAYRGIRSFASKSQGTLSLTSWTSRSLRPEASLATRCPPAI